MGSGMSKVLGGDDSGMLASVSSLGRIFLLQPRRMLVPRLPRCPKCNHFSFPFETSST